MSEIAISNTKQREASMGAPMAHYQRRAGRWLELIRESGSLTGANLIRAGHAEIDVLDALRSNLIVRNAVALAGLNNGERSSRYSDTRVESIGGNTLWSDFRVRAYRVKRWLSRRLPATSYHRPTDGKSLVLAFPRMPGHFADMLPVARELQTRGSENIVFAVLDRPLARQVSSFHLPVLNVFSFGRISRRLLRNQSRSLIERVVPPIESATDYGNEFSRAEIEVLKASTLRTLRLESDDVLVAAYAFVDLLESIRPDLTLVGNPYTFEGRTLSVISKNAKVPTFALEHGSILSNTPQWQDCPSDLVCAWGEVSRRSLLSCGVAEERIATTGSPRYDHVFQNVSSCEDRTDANRAIILVATSGPGDQISHEQHRAFIAAMFRAASMTPSARWLVKLHRKDALSNYETPEAKNCSNVSVVVGDYARDGLEIFDYLRVARGMVTISSAAAFDAMAVGVPVISFNLWPEEIKAGNVEFLERGCTRTVRTAEQLADEVMKAWQLIPNESADSATVAYIDEHFANRGSAAKAVANEVVKRLNARRFEQASE